MFSTTYEKLKLKKTETRAWLRSTLCFLINIKGQGVVLKPMLNLFIAAWIYVDSVSLS